MFVTRSPVKVTVTASDHDGLGSGFELFEIQTCRVTSRGTLFLHPCFSIRQAFKETNVFHEIRDYKASHAFTSFRTAGHCLSTDFSVIATMENTNHQSQPQQYVYRRLGYGVEGQDSSAPVER